jgi:hypothetical protein
LCLWSWNRLGLCPWRAEEEEEEEEEDVETDDYDDTLYLCH